MASVHSGEAPIAGRNLVKTLSFAIFMYSKKNGKFVGLNLVEN